MNIFLLIKVTYHCLEYKYKTDCIAPSKLTDVLDKWISKIIYSPLGLQSYPFHQTCCHHRKKGKQHTKKNSGSVVEEGEKTDGGGG